MSGVKAFRGSEAVRRWYEQLQEARDTDAVEPFSFTDKDDRFIRECPSGVQRQGPESDLELNIMHLRWGR